MVHNRELTRGVMDPGPIAAVGAFLATWLNAPPLLQFGGVVVLLGLAKVARPWTHRRRAGTMAGMVSGTAGALVGAAIGGALRAVLYRCA